MDDLAHPDAGQIAITLIGEDDIIRLDTFDAGGHRRGAPVRGLAEIAVEIVVGQHRAAHRGDADRALADAQFVHHLGDDPVGDAVRAPRAVVCDRVGHGGRALKSDLFAHRVCYSTAADTFSRVDGGHP